jgi:hypothetical protein
LTCTKTDRAAGPCSACRVYQFKGVHIVERSSDSALYCSEHCPCCAPKLKEWAAEPVTIQGEQDSLFVRGALGDRL